MMASIRVFLVGLCALVTFASSVRAEALHYEATQWYSAYDRDIRGAAGVYRNGEGSWSADIDVRGVNPGRYHVRVLVPTYFYSVPPRRNVRPAGWAVVNVCEFESDGRRSRCSRDGLAMDHLAPYMNHAVVEIWTMPKSRLELSRKWCTAPLYLED